LPTKDPSGYVILSLTDPVAASDHTMSILYCRSTTQPCVDESQEDPTLVTQHDPVAGKIWRRIKHFSGYNVAAGEDDQGRFSGALNRMPGNDHGAAAATISKSSSSPVRS